MLDLGNRPRANHHIGLSRKHRLDEPRDVRGAILVVRIRIHNDVRPRFHTGIQTELERSGQSHVAGKSNDVVNAMFSRDP